MQPVYGEDHSVLHWSFGNTHVLFPALRINSFASFIAAALLVIALCFSERFLSFASEEEWTPSLVSRSRVRHALWKSTLYWLITLLRLLYMLCAMSFHAGLLIVITTSLAIAQFLIELRKEFRPQRSSYSSIEQPLLDESRTRPRSKSKPDSIFIHPRESNLARADALALQMGLGGPTDRVADTRYQRKQEAWEVGNGKNLARALLGNSQRPSNRPFNIGSDSDSDS
ncbi:hypothetical protein BT96DRAFT_1012738 [Gymnopus androsaceus JB14]|uniref:Copper transporter n=1 Tax=Gymnopus androsaceus JB14 TaxID=1447944 RepID=A0A6A4IIR9_9AGAR|nr:hypothetical protein BT96DRAFT_1012738 [Gymnopus androsaceus JB14]